MRRINFAATLESEVIISETSATAGSHSSLDYIPGACFLGACATKIYNQLSTEDAFAVFHSGKVRFHNAYPLSSAGVAALPVPASWHYFKGESFLDGSMLKVSAITNLLQTEETTFATWAEIGRQPKQMREGYSTPEGSFIGKSSNYRIKTAIDREEKRAAESQLFGYESLSSGSRWWFSIEIDSDLSQSIDESIATALSGRIRVGRSRSAENGILNVIKVDGISFEPFLDAADAKHLHLYCVSDLALRDPATGTPVTVPEPQHFHLTEGVGFTLERSFIRTRRYAPFNGKRKANDLERQVICKGSVVSFAKKNGAAFSAQELVLIREKMQAGVGMYRQDGLGKVLVNPGFIMNETIQLQESKPWFSSLTKNLSVQPGLNDTLIQWLMKRGGSQSVDVQISQQVDQWANLLVKGINGIKRMGSEFPGNSQWGAVRTIAASPQATKKILEDELFAPGSGLCVHGVSKTQWSEVFKYQNQWIAFSDFLRTVVLAHYNNDEHARKALHLLAERIPKKMNQSKEG